MDRIAEARRYLDAPETGFLESRGGRSAAQSNSDGFDPV